MKKKISLLGATGSIGKSAIDVITRNRDDFEIVLLSAHSNRRELDALSRLWPKAVCVLTGEVGGKEKLIRSITDVCADITINGISGSAGLEPSLSAINSGSNLALANKETIVMAGELVMSLAKEKNVKIIPVDSEHSAIFKLIEAHCVKENLLNENLIKEIILTASGGPFRKLSLKEMENVKLKDALAHPTWKMGAKITIDSASMANKGLEIIEACALFNMPPDKVKAVIHPQSVVHSMVSLCNGVIYAQLSKPDMRHPIHDALYWPGTRASGLESLSFDSLTLEFEKPDAEKFPMLDLAYKAARLGGLYPCAYNAANEAAVSAFLEEKIGFLDIPKITSHVLQSAWPTHCSSIDAVLKADTDARQKAAFYIESR